jgi:hypothetical protein
MEELKLGKMARKPGGIGIRMASCGTFSTGISKDTDLEKHIILDASMKNKTSESI